MKVIAISGSLREDSYNTKLCAAIKKISEDLGVNVEVQTLNDIPFFNEDAEKPSIPDSVRQLKEAIAQSDAVIFSTPEYNNMIPGVLKNAIEWASRHGEEPSVLEGKPVAIVGASTGGFGTVRAQNQLLLLCTILRMKPHGSFRFPLSHAEKVFNESELTDEKTATKLTEFLKQFYKSI